MTLIDEMIADIKKNDPDGWKQAVEEGCESIGHLILPGDKQCSCGKKHKEV